MTKTLVDQPAAAPKVETLLRQAHAAYGQLQALRQRVVSSGVPNDALPYDHELQAFCLLFDYDREQLINRVAPLTPTLAAKNLIADANAQTLSTPMLRFAAQIEHLLDDVQDLALRFEAGIVSARKADSIHGPSISCATQAVGRFGQELRIGVHVEGAEWLLLRPAPIFGLLETSLAIDANFSGTIPLPCDDGEVLIAAMARSGVVNVHTLSVSIGQDAWA